MNQPRNKIELTREDRISPSNYAFENEPRGIVNLAADEQTSDFPEGKEKETNVPEPSDVNFVDGDGYAIVSKHEMPTIIEDDETDREVRLRKGSRRSSLATITEDKERVEGEEEDDKMDDGSPPFVGESLFSRRMIITGGFLDIALFTTNCEQLKAILEIGHYHKHYDLVLGLIVCSMVLQVAVGFTLFMAGCITIKVPDDKKKTDILNHISMGLVALITIVNIFISSFTVKGEVIQRCMRGDFWGERSYGGISYLKNH